MADERVVRIKLMGDARLGLVCGRMQICNLFGKRQCSQLASFLTANWYLYHYFDSSLNQNKFM